MRLKARSKYGAIKETVDGVTFHSRKEARRYQELCVLLKAGEIRDLELQPEFRLDVQPDESDACDPVILGVYRADFRYDERVVRGVKLPPQTGPSIEWEDVIEDVKGFKTPLYKWKKRHVEAQYGVTIREI